MKIVHFADTHYGVENYGRIDSETGLHTRTLDLNRAMDQLVAFVEVQKVDVVLFAGDAYKTRQPTPAQQRQFAQQIQRLARTAHVILVAGNHDLPGSPQAVHTLDIFDTLHVDRAKVFATIDHGGGAIALDGTLLAVVALPWPDPRWLLSDWRSVPISELHGRIVQEVTARLDAAYGNIHDSHPIVLVGHVAMMAGAAREGTERAMTFGWWPDLSPAVLQPERYDYVALGHHHRHQQVAENAYYSGSLQCIDFGEEDEPKGFIYLELDPKAPHGKRLVDGPHFVSVEARRFVTIDAAPEAEDPMPEILRIADAADGQDAIVRVRLALSEEQGRRVDDAAIRAALNRAHCIAGIQRNVDREERRRAAASVETMTPLEALDLYWQSQDLPEEERGRLGKAASELLEVEVTP